MKSAFVLGAVLLGVSLPAFADEEAPSFDRPGIAFSTATVPRGQVFLELGLPDGEIDRQDGIRTQQTAANINARFGLTDRLEVQVQASPWIRQTQTGQPSSRGSGDVVLALKTAADFNETWSWGVLGSVEFSTGSTAFKSDGKVYNFGATLAQNLSGSTSLSYYANVARDRDATTWTLSPAVNFSLSPSLSSYVELGAFIPVSGPERDTGYVIGTGIAKSLGKNAAIDFSFDRGLNDAAPDWTWGVGVSVAF